MSSSEPVSDSSLPKKKPDLRSDLLALTKFRLSVLVLVTTFVGFWLNSGKELDVWLMIHTLVGSAFAAFASGIFNQLMEIEADKKMGRTADRPLPAQRMEPAVAFGIGWMMAAFALIHLAMKVNLEAAVLCAATLGVYIFIYTPMKQTSSWNTMVGAVSGAFPPLIGWAGAAGPSDAYFRLELVTSSGALYLFALLFVWQLPHFLAINWMYREDYLRGGFVMLANHDDAGRQTSFWSLVFAIASLVLVALPALAGDVHWGFVPGAVLVNLALLKFAWTFYKQPERLTARKLFLFTLLYLPLMLALSMMFWRY